MAAQVWHKAPFIRLLAALTAGITLQWYLQLPILFAGLTAAISAVFITIYSFTSIKLRYTLATVNGTAISFLLVSAGAILVWGHDVRNSKSWAGGVYKENSYIVAAIKEPLVEKANSYKAVAQFTSVLAKGSWQKTEGDLILYFKKDSGLLPVYGSEIIFSRNLQEIKNSGNPGAFDYKRYSLFQGITHQAYLTRDDYVLLPAVKKNVLQEAIFSIRNRVVNCLRGNIPGEKESGLAEALLIGYKDDLDKNLVQSYSNTGVVHIIAISGLHLGIIYWLLLFLTKPLGRHKKLLWLRLLLTIAALWAFTLLAGAQPSVLRSAIMFTIIAIGQLAARRTSIYNTMALSAFVLLCINPFWLWDVGFQLSYTAVLSIIIFFKPIANWYVTEKKIMDFFWKLTAVTISAQLLTTPISVYHFHQMPLLFLFTNFIAVPVSSVILLGEIFLCAFAFVTPVAHFTGGLLHHLIYFMNSYIEGLDRVSFSVWNGLYISILQMVLLLVFIVAACYWLMAPQRMVARTAAVSFCIFIALRGISFTEAYHQQKLIVYNVPRHAAIDVLDGRHYFFIGDSTLLYDEATRNFHLQPSRIRHRVSLADHNHPAIKSFRFNGKQVVIADESFSFVHQPAKPSVDILILSKNPKLYISRLIAVFDIKQIVIDGSVPPWKATLWQKDCDSLKISCHNVSEKGAFVVQGR